MRLPPLSAPRAAVIRPKAALVILDEPGSARFGWFGKLLKEPSNLSFQDSNTLKSLPNPRDQLMVPGPNSVPTPALPKRAIGVTLQLKRSAAPATRPGQI